MIYEIPTAPYPRKITTTIAGETFRLTFRWINALNGGWVVDIADANDVRIVGSVPLVTGCDLLRQYGYLNIGVPLVVLTDGAPMVVPSFNTLGVSGHLYFVAP